MLQIPAEDFFLGYRKVAMEPHEILLRVHIPTTREHEYVHEFKQAHRRDDDIAIVNAGMRMLLKEDQPGAYLVGVLYVALCMRTVACACALASDRRIRLSSRTRCFLHS